MNKDDLEIQRTFVLDKLEVHFTWDFLGDKADRQYCLCIIETPEHQFYSGVAILNPKEYLNQDTKTAWKISLKRACEAMDWLFGETIFKHYWHEIRSQLRNEQLAKELKEALDKEIKETTELLMNYNMEESNGQDAS